ncbi:Arginase [Fusarium oxysporum f. sp. albedinis]|nr:Uncharacterized protein HZ326_23435 [Fusarium oxysporum f. sp. albedinis]KAJ0138471.1 Arginase [Fusarium oxysporum f. sp. albedinis]
MPIVSGAPCGYIRTRRFRRLMWSIDARGGTQTTSYSRGGTPSILFQQRRDRKKEKKGKNKQSGAQAKSVHGQKSCLVN